MKNLKKIVGVILAAGKGRRIKPFSLEFPKPLLPICNKPIMQYQIEEMRNLGIEEVIIVIGHLGTKIKEYFGSGKKLGVKITYIKQKKQLGIAHAVGQLEPYIKNPFLLFLGDIFYLSQNLKKMITLFNKYEVGGILAVKKEKNSESIKRNFSLILDKNNIVKRVIEKPRYVTNNLKGCGIYLFSLSIFDAIRNTPRTAMRDEYEITNAIQLLIDYGYKVYPADVINWDINITFAEDLLRCNLEQLARLKVDSVIAPTAKINKKAKIINSVLGEKVLIKEGIKIINSVIFAHTNVLVKGDITDSLVAPNLVFKKKSKFLEKRR